MSGLVLGDCSVVDGYVALLVVAMSSPGTWDLALFQSARSCI